MAIVETPIPSAPERDGFVLAWDLVPYPERLVGRLGRLAAQHALPPRPRKQRTPQERSRTDESTGQPDSPSAGAVSGQGRTIPELERVARFAIKTERSCTRTISWSKSCRPRTARVGTCSRLAEDVHSRTGNLRWGTYRADSWERRGELAEVEFVIVLAEPGNPKPAEGYLGSVAPAALVRRVVDFVHGTHVERDGAVQCIVRWFLKRRFPGMDFDEQLRRVWITQSRLCSLNQSGASYREPLYLLCRDDYLAAQLQLFPAPTTPSRHRGASTTRSPAWG